MSNNFKSIFNGLLHLSSIGPTVDSQIESWDLKAGKAVDYTFGTDYCMFTRILFTFYIVLSYISMIYIQLSQNLIQQKSTVVNF